MERNPRILDVGFNVAVLHIADKLTRGFSVSDCAPSTFDELIAQIERHRHIVVWSEASNATIYGSPEVNYAFRAWHDWCHWRGLHRFTTEGEAAVAKMQADHIDAIYGASDQTHRWRKIIEAQVIGQQRHQERYGHYPTDQFAFVEEYLRSAEIQLANAAE